LTCYPLVPPSSFHNKQAELEGPTGTPFEGKHFRLKLVLPADFPATPPRGHFITKIYHPNVDPSTGAICVNTLKKDWTPETDFSHTLAVIRCLLIVPFPESSLNDEAGKLFMESYDEYAKRARLMADIHGIQREEENEGINPAKIATERSEDRSLKTVNRSGKDTLTKSMSATKKKSLKRL
jgi:ubiquitin-conjugating enzyme E2 S